MVLSFIYISLGTGQAPDEEFQEDEINDQPDINKWVLVDPKNNCYRAYGYERPILCFPSYKQYTDIISLYPNGISDGNNYSLHFSYDKSLPRLQK